MINKIVIKEIEDKLRIEYNENKHLWNTAELKLLSVILGYTKQLNNYLETPDVNIKPNKMFE